MKQLTIEQQGLNRAGPRTHDFYLVSTLGPLHLWVSQPWIKPITNQKQYFQSMTGNSWM